MEATSGMDREGVIHIYNGILLGHKKEWNNIICSNMDGPRDHYIKWRKSDKETQIPCDITFMGNLKYNTNEHVYEAETDLQVRSTDMWLTKRGGGWGINCKNRISRY